MKDSSTMAQNLPKKETNGKTLTLERENLMVPLTANGISTLRTAHFLKPSLNPKNQAKTPSISPCTNPNFILFLQRKVKFKGRQLPLDHWEAWITSLQKTHEELWKKVGIFDAIRVSTYNINKQNELIFGLAEKWCPETKSFVFPWGETTITLEDVMILGGFPVVGSSVRNPFRGEYVEKIKALLTEACSKIRKTCNNQMRHNRWMEYFKGKGGELEHVAFLVLWLSRYVFPTSRNCIVMRNVFDLAITLAKGIKVAIAPAVLAEIYRDLGLLKQKIVAFSRDGSVDEDSKLVLWTPFQLVQVWAWERFPTLSPKPLQLVYGRPRMARWNHERCRTRIVSHSLDVEFEEDHFLWRPYGVKLENWELPEFYSDEGMWVSINFEVNVGLLSFALCLRDCELVSFDCVEQYLPHRVGLQFGYDQDVPVTIPRLNANCELAWSSYDIPLDGYSFYIPPRLFEGDVTMDYSCWWKSVISLQDDSLLVCGSKSRKVKRLSHILHTNVEGRALPLSRRQCSEAKSSCSTGNVVSCEGLTSLSPGSVMDLVIGEEKERTMDGDRMSSCSLEESETLAIFPNEKSLLCAHPVEEVKGSKLFQMSYSGTVPLKVVYEPAMSETGEHMGLETKKSGSVATQIDQCISSHHVFLQESVNGMKVEAPTLLPHHSNDAMSSKDLGKEKSVSCEGMTAFSPVSVMNPLIGEVDSVIWDHPNSMEEDKDGKLNESIMILDDETKKIIGSLGNDESLKAVNEVLMSETEILSELDMNMTGSSPGEVEQITSTEVVEMKQADNALDVEEWRYIESPSEALDMLQCRINRLARVLAIYKDAKFGSKVT